MYKVIGYTVEHKDPNKKNEFFKMQGVEFTNMKISDQWRKHCENEYLLENGDVKKSEIMIKLHIKNTKK